MRGFACFFLFAVFCQMTVPTVCQAQDQSADKPAATPAPTSGARAEFLDEVNYYEQRFTRLAEAIPAEEYTWRPGEGVRSIGEVYMHVVAANYNFAKMLGTALPAGVDPKAMMANATDKAKTVQALKDSFAHFRSAILALKDSDLENPMKLPGGRQSTARGSFVFMAGHFGEHLGQSIAYARQAGIVPPWTEERQKQEAAKPKP